MSRFINPDLPFFLSNGELNSLGVVYFGVENQNAKAAPRVPFSDEALTTPTTATQALNAGGKFAQDIFLGDTPYSMIVDDADGVQVYEVLSYLGMETKESLTTGVNIVFAFATLALATANTDTDILKVGAAIDIKERNSGGDEPHLWDVVSSFTVTPNGDDIVAHDTLSLAFVRRVDAFAGSINSSLEGINTPYFNPSSDVSIITVLSGADTPLDGHRHFGGICRTLSGRIILVHRRAPSHGVLLNTVITYEKSDDEGATFTSEAILIPANPLYDQRESSVGTTSTGRVVVNWSKITGGNNNVFASIYSDDNGDTWSNEATIDTVFEAYSRLFGQVKEVPSDLVDGELMLIQGAYRQVGLDFEAYYYKSYDRGLTWPSETIVVSNTFGYSEMAVAWVNQSTIVAIIRSLSGLTLFTSLDKGLNWTNDGVIPGTSTDSQVAPSINIIEHQSETYIMLGYANRALDLTTWRFDTAKNVFSAAPSDMFTRQIFTGVNDMINASGYQSVIEYPNGRMMFIEFKEYTTPAFPYSDVRIGIVPARKWLPQIIPNLYRFGGTVRTDSFVNSTVTGEVTPAFTSDAGTPSDRIHYSMSVTGTRIAGIGTTVQGLAFFNDADNPIVTIENSSGKLLVNFGANLGTIAAGDDTGFSNASVPSSSTPAWTTSTGTTSSRQHMSFRNPNGGVGGISTTGSTTVFSTSSDPRLKSEFEDLSKREIIQTLGDIADCLGKFSFNSDPSVKIAGFDAHKILDIDGMGSEIGVSGVGPRSSKLGDDCKSEEGEDSQVTAAGVDQSKAVPYLVAAVDLLLKEVFKKHRDD